MKRYSLRQKSIAFASSCAFIFILTSGPADAARRSRVLSIALFASGMSFQLGGSLLKASAQNRYDTYLNAATQADIQAHKDAVLARQNASTLMSRVGIGCVGLAVLFSLYSQLDRPAPAEEPSISAYGLRVDIHRHRIRRNDFENRFSGNTGSLFRLRPHYDFQTRRASLRLLHYF